MGFVMAKCLNCGVQFEAKRVDARCCSAKCRVTLNRKRNIVTDNPDIVTDKPEDVVTDNKSADPLCVEWRAELDALPVGVVRPECKQVPMETDVNNPQEDKDWDGRWQSSVGYMETVWRLIHFTAAELEEIGQWIPAWKHLREAV